MMTQRVTTQPTQPQPHPPLQQPPSVDILILGAGWLYQFLHPLLTAQTITHAATTRNGHDSTIPFTFSPTSKDPQPYTLLPTAKTILITFPLLGASAPTHLHHLYSSTHLTPAPPNYILLGSSGEYTGPGWHDRHSPASSTPSPRWQAETALLGFGGTVLNLSGLIGEPVRNSRIWKFAIPAAKGKAGIAAKRSVHFIHGADVSRAVVDAHRDFDKASGQRWLLTDGHVYDWWDLVWRNAAGLDSRRGGGEEEGAGMRGNGKGREEGQYRTWVAELMREEDVRALPRDGDVLGRRLDGREFWEVFGLVPLEGALPWAPEESDTNAGEK